MAARSVSEFWVDFLAKYDASDVAPGPVSVIPDPGRADSTTASCYRLGDISLVLVAPELVERVEPFESQERSTFGSAPAASVLDRYEQFANALGAKIYGRGMIRTPSLLPDPVNGVIEISRDDANDVARLARLVEEAGPDDVEEAEIDMDDLDPVIRCTETEPGGSLSSYASAYPSTDFAGWWDIGTLTHPDYRRRGLGLRALSALSRDLITAGHRPIYRHNVDNSASAALGKAGGYEVAAEICAIDVSPASSPTDT